MLELDQISVCYGSRAALDGVTLSFPPGLVTAIVGPNGGGKSTLLRTAAGLVPASEGRVLLDGASLAAMKPRQIAQKISWLPQSRDVPDITAWSLVLHGRFPHLGYPRHVGDKDRGIALRALEAVDGVELAPRMLPELSGGQRQKVYIAMALAQQTETILLDEPTTYLDIAHQLQVTQLSRRLAAEGKAVGLVLHDLPLALETSDRIAVLDNGRLEALGPPEEVFRGGVLPRVFGVTMERVETASGPRYICGRDAV